MAQRATITRRHGKVAPRQAAPGRLLAFQFHLLVCTFTERYWGWPRQTTPRPAACFSPLYVCTCGDTPSRYLPVAVLHSTTCHSYACTAHALHGSGGHSHNVILFAGGVALYLARVARLVKFKILGGRPVLGARGTAGNF